MAPPTSITASSLTSEQVLNFLIRPLETASVFLAAGPRIFDTTGEPVRVPKLSSMGTPNFVAEGSAIPEVDPSFSEVVLLPSTIRPVSSITRFSNQLARQSVVDLTVSLRDKMVRDVADVLDTAFISGSGAGTASPTGILNYTGVTVAGSAIGTATVDDLYDALAAALDENVNPATLRWMMAPRDFVQIHKLKDSTGRSLVSPDPTTGAIDRLLGFPVTTTSKMPTSHNGGTAQVVLADFEQIAVARDLTPSVTILPERYAEYDQQAIRVITRYDAQPLNADAIIKLTGITAWGTA
jgi:HK97 family phage major capsid protein